MNELLHGNVQFSLVKIKEVYDMIKNNAEKGVGASGLEQGWGQEVIWRLCYKQNLILKTQKLLNCFRQGHDVKRPGRVMFLKLREEIMVIMIKVLFILIPEEINITVKSPPRFDVKSSPGSSRAALFHNS